MVLELPVPNNSYFQGMTVCGRLIKAASRHTLFGDFNGRETWADFQLENRQMSLAVVWGKSLSQRIHIDYVVLSEHTKWVQAGEKQDLNVLLSQLEAVFGQRISGTFFGRYRVPKEDLPNRGLVDFLNFKTQWGKHSIAMKGSELAIEGGPIDSFAWRIDKDNEHFIVDLKGKVYRTIDCNYLIEIERVIDRAFRMFALESAE